MYHEAFPCCLLEAIVGFLTLEKVLISCFLINRSSASGKNCQTLKLFLASSSCGFCPSLSSEFIALERVRYTCRLSASNADSPSCEI